MYKFFLASLKILLRDRQLLFWSFMFPLMFTFIFGFFFGKGSTSSGTIALVNNSNSQLSQSLEKAMTDSSLFKVQKETDLNTAKNLITTNKVVAVVQIPQNFGSQIPNSPTKVVIYDDPANAQANSVILGFLNNYLTSTDYKIQNFIPVYSLNEQKTNTRQLNYFDFILIGLLGMALMNSSVNGIAVGMSKYREDKILKRITTTPLPSWRFIVANLLSRLVINFAQVSLILIIGVYYFQAHIYGSVPLIYLLSLLGAVLFQLIGFTIAGFTKTTQAAEGMATSVTIPMMFLAGVFFPIEQLPKWLFSVVQYLPLAPLLRIMRNLALDNASPLNNPSDLILIGAWIVGMLIISSYKFRLNEE